MEKNNEKIDEKQKEIYNKNLEVLNNQVIRDFFVSKFGENSLKLIKSATDAATDDVLAKRCKIKVSEVRTLLNKFHELGLSSYTRIKDKEVGWYSYIWLIDIKNAAAVIEREMAREMAALKEQIDSATTVFSYYCPKCSRGNTVGFDLAAGLGFKCPNCGKPLKELKVDQREAIDKLNELQQKYELFKNINTIKK